MIIALVQIDLTYHILYQNNLHFFLDCPLYYVQRLALRNTVSRYFRLETLLYGDDNLDYKTDVAIVLAVNEFIKDSERF